ncbi:MAG: tetratricopeptide repeat protein [Verrucomicrobia bacterium]|nr:tetratricopeptide repeat protein [Verrucomicrobiota bacterium]MDE3100468.1 tetratricopeptide repeat protein [Verrucomicrobiota bacterium]
MTFIGQIVNAALSILGLGFAGWLCWRALKRSVDPAWLIVKWILTLCLLWVMFFVAVPLFAKGGPAAIIGLLVALIWGLAMAAVWRHSIIDLIANPLGSLYDGGDTPLEPKPFYSIALAKRKLNRPLEAIVAVRGQLARFPNDYEGVLLLATIQAEDMKDLPSAETTLNRFCAWEQAPPRQVAASLSLLADWQLKIAQDAGSARAALERIIEKYPDTDLSTAAAQRIAHLGGAEKMLIAATDRQPVTVPEGVASAGLRDTMQDLVPAETAPQTLAAQYVAHLAEHPLDVEAREKLAIIYARHYGRVDLAAGELEQLLAQPGQTPRRMAHWLNLFADLQIQAGMDYDTVRTTLERIIERFPDLPAAHLARMRLSHLRLEIHGQKEARPGKPLGEYEQDIGLKTDRAPGSTREL